MDFDSILWRSINQKRSSIYVTQLKSRIYKASNARLHAKVAFLQNILMYSLSSRHAALKMVKDNTRGDQFDMLADSEKLRFVCQCNIEDLCIQLNNPFNKASLAVNFTHALLLFALEPICHCRTAKKKFFFGLHKPQQSLRTLATHVTSPLYNNCYATHIYLRDFISEIPIEYMAARMHSSNIVTLLLGTRSMKDLISNLVLDVKHQETDHSKLAYGLFNSLCLFFNYYLSCEALYLMKSKVFLRTSSNNVDIEFVQIISYGCEILLFSSNKDIVNNWRSALSVMFKVDHLNERDINSNHFNFLGYSFVRQNNAIFRIAPSKLSQMHFINSVRRIFQNCKNCAINDLIVDLNNFLHSWIAYFGITKSARTFVLLDYLIHLKVRSWIFRKHNMWPRSKVKHKYFLQTSGKLKIGYANSEWILSAAASNRFTNEPKILLLSRLRNSVL